MNDRQINTLVRMALEAEELEVSSQESTLKLVGEEATVPRRTRLAPVVLAGLGLAAAAAIALVFVLPAVVVPTPPPVPPVVTNHENVPPTPPTDLNAIIRHLEFANYVHPAPGIPGAPAAMSVAERFDPGMVERSMVMAIYRGQRGHMQCVNVAPHEWSDNKCLSEVTPQELRCVATGPACSASPDHTLVVALSGPQKSLPHNESDAMHLATCILGAPCENDSKCLSLTANECVPAGVSVRIETIANSR